MQKRAKKLNKGITLISLIITIILLLILSGVILNLTLGNRGIFNIATNAGKNYMDAQNSELNELDKLYSQVLVADDSKVTLSMQELNEYIDRKMEEKMSSNVTGINENSVLMTSINSNLNVGEAKLNSFSNEFNKGFSEYFEYDDSTGEMTCLKDGQYLVVMQLDMCLSSQWSSTIVTCSVNNTDIGRVWGCISTSTAEAIDCNSINIYLKKGDKLNILKSTDNVNVTRRNNVVIELIKM